MATEQICLSFVRSPDNESCSFEIALGPYSYRGTCTPPYSNTSDEEIQRKICRCIARLIAHSNRKKITDIELRYLVMALYDRALCDPANHSVSLHDWLIKQSISPYAIQAPGGIGRILHESIRKLAQALPEDKGLSITSIVAEQQLKTA